MYMSIVYSFSLVFCIQNVLYSITPHCYCDLVVLYVKKINNTVNDSIHNMRLFAGSIYEENTPRRIVLVTEYLIPIKFIAHIVCIWLKTC